MSMGFIPPVVLGRRSRLATAGRAHTWVGRTDAVGPKASGGYVACGMGQLGSQRRCELHPLLPTTVAHRHTGGGQSWPLGVRPPSAPPQPPTTLSRGCTAVRLGTSSGPTVAAPDSGGCGLPRIRRSVLGVEVGSARPSGTGADGAAGLHPLLGAAALRTGGGRGNRGGNRRGELAQAPPGWFRVSINSRCR